MCFSPYDAPIVCRRVTKGMVMIEEWFVKNGMANRRGVGCVSVGQKALKEASLSNIGTPKQNDLGINVCLALLCVSHRQS